MAFLASDIMRRTQVVLQDLDGTRWPPSELAFWINDGLNEIAVQKPSARTTTMALPLVLGTLQALPDAARSLLRVTCNLRSSAPRIAGRVVRTATRLLMDQAAPDWHDTDVYPPEKIVQTFISDEMDQRAFHVFPANDGTGLVEALVAVRPAPVTATGGVDLVASYNVEVDIDDLYQTALVDYVLYRALQKDAVFPGNAMRAQTHYASFANAIGLKLKNELLAQPKSTSSIGIPSSGPEAG